MPRMPETIAALQRGTKVIAARLVRLEFASETKLLHQGFGKIRTADGLIWEGVGKLGQISDIDRSVVPKSGVPVTLTLSGVDPDLIAKSLAAPEQVKGKPCKIFDQHFDEDYRLLDAPQPVVTALMDRMLIQDNGLSANITVSTLTLLYNRRRPAYGYLNAASQRKRFPGDGGADQISRLMNSTAKWPEY